MRQVVGRHLQFPASQPRAQGSCSSFSSTQSWSAQFSQAGVPTLVPLPEQWCPFFKTLNEVYMRIAPNLGQNAHCLPIVCNSSTPDLPSLQPWPTPVLLLVSGCWVLLAAQPIGCYLWFLPILPPLAISISFSEQVQSTHFPHLCHPGAPISRDLTSSPTSAPLCL